MDGIGAQNSSALFEPCDCTPADGDPILGKGLLHQPLVLQDEAHGL
jgi:hypothetical protein